MRASGLMERDASGRATHQKHSVPTTAALLVPKDMDCAAAQKIMMNSVRPYTDLRPNLSPAQPKNSWPARVPHSATDDTAASTLMGSLPGLTRPLLYAEKRPSVVVPAMGRPADSGPVPITCVTLGIQIW